jgi:hypothetical protein
MNISTWRSAWRHLGLAMIVGAIVAAAPRAAAAQSFKPETPDNRAIGERYHVEVSGTLWNPSLFGVISSEQFGIIGSDIDFTSDLGFEKTRFKDLRIVLRPGKKHRFRFQYTPVSYTAATNFQRTIKFNGILFPVSVPIQSEVSWKVWRFGYEYDFVYTPRGFVGVLLEGRYTQFSAHLATASPLLATQADEYTEAKAPLPAIGLVGRAYPLKEVAINFEVSGFHVPDIDPKYKANYYDWDIYGTVNLTNNVGMQIGWRRMTTFLSIEKDMGDLKFQGMWFGAAIRY